MYAIVQIGGRQYRAAPGQRVVVDRMNVEPGSQIQLFDVRMVVAEAGDQATTTVGTPTVAEFSVSATALSHFRGPKMLVFKYKPKKRYRRKRGFRAELTELRIDGVGSAIAESVAAAGAPKVAARKPRSKTAAAPESTAEKLDREQETESEASPVAPQAAAKRTPSTAKPSTARKAKPTAPDSTEPEGGRSGA